MVSSFTDVLLLVLPFVTTTLPEIRQFLHFAKFNHLGDLEAMLAWPHDPVLPESLRAATRQGHADVVRLLLEAGGATWILVSDLSKMNLSDMLCSYSFG